MDFGYSGEWPLARTIRSRSGSTKPGSAGRLKAPELLGKCSFRYHYRDVPAPLPPSVRFFFSFLFFSWVRDWCVGYSRKSRLPDLEPTSASLYGFRIFSSTRFLKQNRESIRKQRRYIATFNLRLYQLYHYFYYRRKNISRQSDISSAGEEHWHAVNAAPQSAFRHTQSLYNSRVRDRVGKNGRDLWANEVTREEQIASNEIRSGSAFLLESRNKNEVRAGKRKSRGAYTSASNHRCRGNKQFLDCFKLYRTGNFVPATSSHLRVWSSRSSSI